MSVNRLLSTLGSDVSGIPKMRLVVGVMSAMVEKEFGEMNFGFAALKYMNREMKEKRIVTSDCLSEDKSPTAHRRQRAAGLRRETIASLTLTIPSHPCRGSCTSERYRLILFR